VPERIADLVYLDAFIPEDGQSCADIAPDLIAMLRERAWAQGTDWCVSAPDDPDLPFPAKHLPQPLKTFAQPVAVRSLAAAKIPRTVILCTKSVQWREPYPFAAACAKRARAARARYRELATRTGAMFSMPRELADLLLDVAALTPLLTPALMTVP
jgi:hypothetical protein